MKLEIEKKYIVKFPKSWSDLASLFDRLVDVKRIEQVYLKQKEGDQQSARVRKTIEGLSGDTNIVYHFNIKKRIELMVNQEIEKEITKSKYEEYLKDKSPKNKILSKTRFVFKYQDQIFELDVFKGDLKGLAILEIELKDKKQEVTLPPFLKIEKDVSEIEKYNNFNLSLK